MINTILALGGGEILLAVLVFLLLFGSSKIPELAKGLGKGLHEFKKATDDIKREIHDSTNGITKDINESISDIKRNVTDITGDISKDINKSTADIRKDINEINTNLNS
jgi:sec-independent protein translocase protein TatA